MKRTVFAVGFAGLLLLLGLGLAEAFVRAANPTPRRLIVRASKVGPLTEVGGVPLWEPRSSAEPHRQEVLEGRRCRDQGRPLVLVLGDSIFHGINVPAEEVASTLARAMLQQRHPELGFCFVNLAVSGFSLYQSVARAERELTELHPDVVLMELWGGLPRVPTRLDDTVYFFEDLPRGEDGLANPLGLPVALNGRLFRSSRLYEYAVMALPEQCPDCNDLGEHAALLDGVLDRTRAGGGELVTLMPAQLYFDFDDQPDAILEGNQPLVAWAEQRGVSNVKLWERFDGLDPAPMRLDNAHLSAAGHARLAEVFVAEVERVLELPTH